MLKGQTPKRKKYSRAFKIEACNLVLKEKLSAMEAAKQLGVARTTLDRWVRELKKKKEHAFPGEGKVLGKEAEYKSMKEKIKFLEMENAILKKVQACFTKLQK